MGSSITNIRTGLLYGKNRLIVFIFFLIHFSRVGVGAGRGNPSSLGEGLGVNFLSPPDLEAGLGTIKRGRGRVC